MSAPYVPRKSDGLTRRSLLRGLLAGSAVTVGLPPLERFFNGNGTAYAACGTLPRRFGVWMWGNGGMPERFTPVDQGPDYTLSPLLLPMAALKAKIAVITGMKVETGNPIAHWSGVGGILTGTPLITRGGEEHTFAAPTIDQIAARTLGRDTRFASLEIGVERGAQAISYNGPDSPNAPETRPAALFDRVFGGGFVAPGENPVADPRLRLRRSVLDAVAADARQLNNRLGAADRRRLDQHLSGIRDLERRVARLEESPPVLAACARPAAPLDDYPDIEGRPQFTAVAEAMADLLALAMACDQTRVFSHLLHNPVSNALFPDSPMGHHRLTHDEPGDQPEVARVMDQIMNHLAHFLGRLDAVDEGEGTLLDHCAVMCTTDVSFGRTHSLEDFPVLVAGGACGRIKTGFHYRSPALDNASKVGLSLLRAVGVSAASFGGGPGLATEGLSAIEVT